MRDTDDVGSVSHFDEDRSAAGSGECCGTRSTGPARSPKKAVAIRITGGYYLTAENGGGSSVHTDRTDLGLWETLRSFR